MTDYTIIVNTIEELQDRKDLIELDIIFNKAKSTIIQGQQVLLARKNKVGTVEKFDSLSTEVELNNYKKTVYKYL